MTLLYEDPSDDGEPASAHDTSANDNGPTIAPIIDAKMRKPTSATLRLEADSFPDQSPKGSNQIPGTLENVRHLLKAAGIRVSYNVIAKRLQIDIPGVTTTLDNRDNASMTRIVSLASANGLSGGHVVEYVAALADENSYNPVAKWIVSKPWDGKDRFPEFSVTVLAEEDYPQELKDALLRKWLLSAVAAALKPSGFKTRGVLTLQGPQGIGKTSWTKRLISDPKLRDDVIKVDHLMDAASKDSILGAISHWIVEIGELDASFKRDISRLKGFLTADSDKIRVPYARAASEYQRRTVFVATVNEEKFLVDATGNTRFWTIPVKALYHSHSVDMQQLFAQLAVDFEGGAEWWLSPAEERMLDSVNSQHTSLNAIEEKVRDALDFERIGSGSGERMTAIALLKRLGIDTPTNGMCKDCAIALRKFLGDPAKVRGYTVWKVPLAAQARHPNTILMPDDDRF